MMTDNTSVTAESRTVSGAEDPINIGVSSIGIRWKG